MDTLPAVTDLLPHRRRWLLIDHLVAVDLAAGSVSAIGRFDEAFTDGHFPERAVVPGVALLEAMAQTMGCLARLSDPDAVGTPYLAAFDQVRFRAPVFPPAEVLFQVTLRERRMGLTMASGEARWEGRRVCSARLTGGMIVRE
jgi:3-hydroxyacyl-[acyl-carrier-protein] dehydratase